MKYYLEITLLPSADIGQYFLWKKVFQQIHLGLVEMQEPNGSVPVGIGFPEYNTEKHLLGGKLRLFAMDEATLVKFDTTKWLNRLSDYVYLTGIRKVPDNVYGYACYKRQQLKPTKERLARRKAKREGVEYEQAINYLEGYEERLVKTPFINMHSESSGRRFRFFIIKDKAENLINEGFNSYGLSHKSTVPEF